MSVIDDGPSGLARLAVKGSVAIIIIRNIPLAG
jgi:hypothetical protein